MLDNILCDVMEWCGDFCERYALFLICVTVVAVVSVAVTRAVYG